MNPVILGQLQNRLSQELKIIEFNSGNLTGCAFECLKGCLAFQLM